MKICIVCQKEVEPGRAARIREDTMIQGIRKAKQWIGIAKNNELYVCEQDYDAHVQRRKGFEKNLVISSVIGAGLVVFLLFLPLLAGRLDIGNIISAVGVGVLVVVAVVFFSYTAAIEPMETAAPSTAAAPEPTRVEGGTILQSSKKGKRKGVTHSQG